MPLHRLSVQVVVALLLIAAACWGVYYSSLSVPFYLDDVSSITANAAFRNATLASLYDTYGLRVVGYISLWWDYKQHALDVTPYHITNVFIHLINGWLAFSLAYLLGRQVRPDAPQLKLIAIATLCGLLFVLHPLQSQAVTYIVQRLAALVTLFYLASLTAYVGFRMSRAVSVKALLLVIAVVMAALALFTKQNAFTLPIVIVALEVVIFRSLSVRYIVFAGLAALAVVVAGYLIVPDTVGPFLTKVDMLTRENKDMSRFEYFTVQLPVLWMYLSKIVWPWPLQLEFDLRQSSFAVWQIISAAIGHVVILGFAWLAKRRLPLVAFGIFFFYIAHLVESALIPITDLAFEHRNYLPDFGMFLAIATLCVSTTTLLPSSWKMQYKAAVPVVILLLLGYTTYIRNLQWQDPDVFYKNEMALAPTDVRTIHNYAEYKLKQGDTQTALKLLDKMYGAAGGEIDGVMVNTHLAVLINTQQYDKALSLGQKLLESWELAMPARAVINSNMGVIYTNLQQYAKAKPYYDKAIKQGVLPVNSLIAYAYTLFVLNDLDNSEKICKEILRVEPGHQKAKQLLGMIQAKRQG
ncbi:tetratricopeptide repeat protein [Alteromonas halophila]|uniref:Tetratricopeptide repeat protein n=1 Tax=Alteromonas halophila TaxID=516698 RepID=A0A918JIR2_9ALTE|nr:hypothetical protein [Alteromonas halophila]GGW82230.1 hypothetical protein GCM10007391_14060 [Alteromonas halophila]